MATKEDIKEKLNILGLDLENLPEFLTETKPIIFNPSRLNNDKELKVYKYVPIKDIEIKELLKHSLTDKINDREVYMKGIDNSYLYEGYFTFKTEEL